MKPDIIWMAEIKNMRTLALILVSMKPPYALYVKRCIDMCLALVLLMLVSPLFIATAVIVSLSGIGSPLFLQRRPGLGGQLFTIIKFRTMTQARDAGGQLLPDAERLTSIGRFIRRTSIDEVPQLLNVLRGDMSLVGPRPLLEEYLPLYNDKQKRRHEVRPGITGLAQVNGRNTVSWEQRFDLDVRYVDELSFALDCRILGLTFFKVFLSEGITPESSVTMEKFS